MCTHVHHTSFFDVKIYRCIVYPLCVVINKGDLTIFVQPAISFSDKNDEPEKIQAISSEIGWCRGCTHLQIFLRLSNPGIVSFSYLIRQSFWLCVSYAISFSGDYVLDSYPFLLIMALQLNKMMKMIAKI